MPPDSSPFGLRLMALAMASLPRVGGLKGVEFIPDFVRDLVVSESE